MRASLLAIADELRRLKAQGLRHVPVSEEGLQALRRAMASVGTLESTAAAGVQEARPPVLKMDPVDRTHLGAAAAEPSSGASHSALASPAGKPPKLKELEAPSLPPIERLVLPAGTKEEQLAALRARVLADPTFLEQRFEGAAPVFAEGSLDSPIMICGEVPALEEMEQGKTFVGEPGKLLTKIVEAMGLKRDRVFLTYLMPWRHKAAGGAELERSARPPTDEELRYGVAFLRAQLEIVRPSALIMLGASASRAVLGPKAFRIMSDARGKWFDFEGWPVLVTYDPSYLVRQTGATGEKKSKRVVWESMLMAMEKAALPISEKQRGFFLS